MDFDYFVPLKVEPVVIDIVKISELKSVGLEKDLNEMNGIFGLS